MGQSGRRSAVDHGWLLTLGVVMVLAGASRARAAEVDVRHFQVSIDNKPAGAYHLAIRHLEDGAFVVTGQAEVRVTVLGITAYHYSYNGREVWNASRLLRLDSTSDDDGNRFAVTAIAEGDVLRVRSNGQDQVAPKDVWGTSCWRLPGADYRNRALTLLDVDTGRPIQGNLQFVGAERVNAAGQVLDCTHYRVTGGVQLELWFDAKERLVREESVEQGHRTTLELTGMGQ